MIWLIVSTVGWIVTFLAAVILVRVVTAVTAFARPPAVAPVRRDRRWLIGWLLLMPVALAVVCCEAGGFYAFTDPAGGDWEFDGHGWPLTVPRQAVQSGGGSSAMQAICWMAVAVDLLSALLLVVAVRLVVDRGLAAWDGPNRWLALARGAAGWCVALATALFCERWAARPITLPGTEVIVYSTLVYQSPLVRAGVLSGVASIVYLLALATMRGWRTFQRLRDEGVV